MCNDCYSNFPFSMPLTSPPPFAFPSPLADSLDLSVRLLPVCLVLIPQRVCLLLLLLPSILHQTRVCRAVYPVCLPPSPPPFASCLLPTTPLFIWRICYPYTDATFGQRSLLCKMHVQHTMSLSKLWGANFSTRNRQEGAAVGEG